MTNSVAIEGFVSDKYLDSKFENGKPFAEFIVINYITKSVQKTRGYQRIICRVTGLNYDFFMTNKDLILGHRIAAMGTIRSLPNSNNYLFVDYIAFKLGKVDLFKNKGHENEVESVDEGDFLSSEEEFEEEIEGVPF